MGMDVDAGTITVTAHGRRRWKPKVDMRRQRGRRGRDRDDVTATARPRGRGRGYIGANAADSAANVTTDVDVGTTGTITILADALMKADADVDGGGFGGLLALSLYEVTATVSGRVSSYVRDGVDLDAGTLNVKAGTDGTDRVQMVAEANSTAGNVSFVAAQDIAPTASVTGIVEAFIGAPAEIDAGGPVGANITVTNSPLNVLAYSDIDATAGVEGGSGSLAVSVNIYKPTANAGGTTRAVAGDGTDVSAGTLKLFADGDARADADLFALSLSGFVAVSALRPSANVINNVEAYIGRGLGEATVDQAEITLSGAADIDAIGRSIAEATATGVAVSGGVSVNAMNAVATLAGATRAYIGKQTTLGATTVDLRAEEASAQAIADITGGAGAGLVAVAALEPVAIASRATEALVGADSQVTLTGSFTATARTETGQPLADASLSGGSGAGLVSVNVMKTTAIVGDGDRTGDGINDDPEIQALIDDAGLVFSASATRAAIGDGVTISATTITLDAKSNTNAKSLVEAGSGAGLVAGSVTTVTANSSHDTEARIGDGSTVTATGGAVTLLANGTTTANPGSDTGGGAGLAEFQTATIRTIVSSDTTAAIGGASTVTGTTVKLDASATHTASGAADSAGGAGIATIASSTAGPRTGSANVAIGKAGDATGTTINTTGDWASMPMLTSEQGQLPGRGDRLLACRGRAVCDDHGAQREQGDRL